MGAPLLIGIAGGRRDREVASFLLRSVLDWGHPYQRVAFMGARELYDGVEWTPRPDLMREFERIDEHLANARESGIAYLIAELDEASERGASRIDLLCSVGTARPPCSWASTSTSSAWVFWARRPPVTASC